MEAVYEGKEYISEQEQSLCSCDGCVFNKVESDGSEFCDCENHLMSSFCTPRKIIWKEKSMQKVNETSEEPKFTVEQVLLAAGNYLREQPVFQDYDKIYETALEAITEDLMFQQDPDYQLYLLLKQKYDKA